MADWSTTYDPRARHEAWRLAQEAKAARAAVTGEPDLDPLLLERLGGPPPDTTAPAPVVGPEYSPAIEPDTTQMEVDAATSAAEQAAGQARRTNATVQQAAERAQAHGTGPGRAEENIDTGAGLYGSASENLQQKTVTRSPRPGYGPNKAALEKEGKLISEVPKLQGNVQEAELGQAMMQSDLLQAEADKQQELHAEMIGRQQAQAAREQAVRQKVFETQDVVQKSVAEAAKASDIDPDRAWGEKGIGAKIAAVIAAGLLGWAGMDPFAHINSVIQNSLDAQKYNRDQKRAQVGIATNAANAQLSAYDQIRAQIGDEQVADEAYRLRSLQVIYAQAEAKLADAGVTVLSEKQKLFMNGLEQQITEQMRKVGVAAEANTPYVTSVRPALTGLAAKLEYEKGKTGLGMVEKGAEQSAAMTGDFQKQQAEFDQKQREAAAKAGEKPAEIRRIEDANRRWISEHTVKPKRIQTLAQNLLDDISARSGDVPGRGWYVPGLGAASHTLTADARKFKRNMGKLLQYDIADYTGANSNETQNRLAEAYMNGGEDEVRAALEDLIGEMSAAVNTIEAAAPQQAAEIRQHENAQSGRSSALGWQGARTNTPAGESDAVEED